MGAFKIFVAGWYEMSPSPSEYNPTTFSQLQREGESSNKPFSELHCFIASKIF